MIPFLVVSKADLKESSGSPSFSHVPKKSFLDFYKTAAIRIGHNRSKEAEHSEPIYETSSYVYKNCAESEDIFSGKISGNVYSRFTNPTVSIFEKRLAVLEDADDAIGTASGMAALLSICITFLSAGDHVICSRSVFGSSALLLRNFIAKFNVSVSFVSQVNLEDWENAIRPNTRLFFCESPSNPTLDVIDIHKLALLAHSINAYLVIDNTFCTPVGQKPILLGADIVLHSASKYIDGQGRSLGGGIVGNFELMNKVRTFMRSAGPAMTAHNAWIFLKGMETLELRIREHSKNAEEVASWLSYHPRIERVIYTGLPSHPQYRLACQQQYYHGGVVSFLIKGGKREAWELIDKLQLISLTTNIGDTKSMITHPASTTHVRISKDECKAIGIGDNLIRLFVGLEDVQSIILDLNNALNST